VTQASDANTITPPGREDRGDETKRAVQPHHLS
jgi:hypothetical protein